MACFKEKYRSLSFGARFRKCFSNAPKKSEGNSFFSKKGATIGKKSKLNRIFARSPYSM